MRAPRRWHTAPRGDDPDAIAAGLPAALHVTDGFRDEDELRTWQDGVRRWLDVQFPGRSDELYGPVSRAYGVTVAHWYAARLGVRLPLMRPEPIRLG